MSVRIHGKTYHTVASRLHQARGTDQPPTGITSITTTLLDHMGRLFVHAQVTFIDGSTFTGLEEAYTGDQAERGAEQDAPVPTAETSAVGRALAFAGYPGSDDSIAGAEEVQRAQQRSQPQPREVHLSGKPTPPPAPQLAKALTSLADSPPPPTPQEPTTTEPTAHEGQLPCSVCSVPIHPAAATRKAGKIYCPRHKGQAEAPAQPPAEPTF